MKQGRRWRLWQPTLRPKLGRKLAPELRVPNVSRLAASFADGLGVRVYEYQPAVLHCKTLVADDYLAFAGSSNLDFQSFHFNAECNVVMLDADTGRAFSEAFETDMEPSTEITSEVWKRRPLLHRIGDAFARSLGPVL